MAGYATLILIDALMAEKWLSLCSPWHANLQVKPGGKAKSRVYRIHIILSYHVFSISGNLTMKSYTHGTVDLPPLQLGYLTVGTITP